MANEFTSIAASAGFPTNTVKPAWDLFFRTALNAQPTCRQFVDVRPTHPTHRGDSVTLQIEKFYGSAAIVAAKAALTEEADVDSTRLPATSTVTLTPVERGGVNSRTLKVANRTMVPIDPVIAMALADWSAKTHDEVIQDGMVAGTQVLYGGGQSSTGALTNSHVLTTPMLMKAVTKLRANQAQPRDGSFYAGLIHPNVAYDLRSETGANSWLVPNQYGTDQGRIWAGEVGAYQGVRFVENARLRTGTDGASSAVVYRSFLLGREALCEAAIVEPEVRFGPVVDKLARFRNVGWYSDLDTKIFRDAAIVRFETGSGAAF